MNDLAPGSVLSDGTILRLVEKGRVRIDPWDPSLVQPASVDLRLGDSFRVFHNHRASAIDLREPPQNLTEEIKIGADEPFVIHPGEFCLATTLEWVELPDDIVARIEGKALALDTPIPTPQGWKTMGGLEPGDEVLDHRGWPTAILAATEPISGRPCREVVFSDGTTIVADASHGWAVRTKVDRAAHRPGPGRVLTTDEIGSSLRYGREWNHHVVQAAPVQYAEQELEIPPCAGSISTRRGTPGLLVSEPIPRAYLEAREARRALLAIIDVRPVKSVPVRCIEIAHPEGLFLASRAFIPTHNSSLGRLGLIVHATAGFCDPGWKGALTLELNNLTRIPIKLWPGMLIAQLSFMALDAPAQRPYGSAELGSHYQGQAAATESRYEGARKRPGVR